MNRKIIMTTFIVIGMSLLYLAIYYGQIRSLSFLGQVNSVWPAAIAGFSIFLEFVLFLSTFTLPAHTDKSSAWRLFACWFLSATLLFILAYVGVYALIAHNYYTIGVICSTFLAKNLALAYYNGRK